MCYFDQTRWSCGFWRWGHFRQQCNKENRMGETCGLKLVYETRVEPGVCKLCHDTEKKQRRYDKMYRDVQRWQREGNRTATIERTSGDMQDVLGQIYRMREEHENRLQSLGQVSSIPWSSRTVAGRAGGAKGVQGGEMRRGKGTGEDKTRPGKREGEMRAVRRIDRPSSCARPVADPASATALSDDVATERDAKAPREGQQEALHRQQPDA